MNWNELKQLKELDFDEVANWPRVAHIISTTLIFILGAILGYIVSISGLNSQYFRYQNQISTAQKQISAPIVSASTLDDADAEQKALYDEFSDKRRLFISPHQIPNLLKHISQIGLESNIHLTEISLLESLQHKEYTERPQRLIISGGYAEFIDFLTLLIKMQILIVPTHLSIEQEKDTLLIHMQISTYSENQETN